MIDWKKYVDHIYIVDYVGTDSYVRNKFNSELKRVGIDRNDPTFVTTFTNINTEIYKCIHKHFFTNYTKAAKEYNHGINVTLCHYYCMKLAKANNYEKIAIFESDAIFYDDLDTIEFILNNAINIINDGTIDLFLGGSGCLSLNGNNINYEDKNIYINMNYNVCSGSTFNIYNKKAYNYFINLIDNHTMCIIDEYNVYTDNIKIGISNIYLCVQCFWDMTTEGLYEHYDMLKPTDDKINNMIDLIYNKQLFFYDGRDLKTIFYNCLRHYNLEHKLIT